MACTFLKKVTYIFGEDEDYLFFGDCILENALKKNFTFSRKKYTMRISFVSYKYKANTLFNKFNLKLYFKLYNTNII